MTRVYVNRNAFQYIEGRGVKGATAEQLGKKLGVKKRSAASWLSKWAAEGYLRHDQGAWKRPGVYYIDNSCKWWGEKVFDSERKYH